jgi:hypothetical protein
VASSVQRLTILRTGDSVAIDYVLTAALGEPGANAVLSFVIVSSL